MKAKEAANTRPERDNKRSSYRVVIAWIAGRTPCESNKHTPWDGTVTFLDSYHGIRVYEKDKYDSRLDMEREFLLPFFDEPELALEHMQRHEGHRGMCQIALTSRARRVLNLDRVSFSDFSL